MQTNSKSLRYMPFDSSISEKLEIVNFKMVTQGKDNILVYKLKKQLDNGDIVTYYKVTKFFRLIRTSRSSNANKLLPDIHADIMRALYLQDIHFVQVIANILNTPDHDAYGLLFFYGVQATGATEEEAIRDCERNYSSLIINFQASHKTHHISLPTKEEINWIFKKLKNQKYITVVKGIPSIKETSGNRKNIFKTEVSTDEQMEQFLTGLVQEEFMMLLMATPIPQKSLMAWLTKSLKEQTRWESQKQGSKSFSAGVSIPMGVSMNEGLSRGSSTSTSLSEGTSTGTSIGTSTGESFSENRGVTEGRSYGESIGSSYGRSEGTSEGVSSGTSSGTSTSTGTSQGTSTGASVGLNLMGLSGNFNTGSSTNVSSGSGTTSGVSTGTSSGKSSGESWGTSSGESYSTGYGTSKGTSESSSFGTSTGSSVGTGSSSGSSLGFGKSLGIAPSLSIGKTYQFTDVEVAYIAELLNTQNQRLKNATEGEGMFYVDIYISTADEGVQKAVQGLIASSWLNPDAKIDVVRGIIPDKKDQKKLALHMQAMTPCLEMDINDYGKYYKWASVLQSSELSSYSVPPRMTLGGIENAPEDRPIFRVPVTRQNKEIFIGNVMNNEVFNIKQFAKHGNGYMSDYKFTIGKDELHHAFINGQAGSGKTVLATRMIEGLYNNVTDVDKLTGKKKRKRILVLDPKGEWRLLGNVIPKGKFKFASVSNPNFHPLKLNLMRVPKYVSASDYYNMIVEMFTSSYGLMDRAVAQIGSVIYDLYEKAGAFDNSLDPSWANERTANITLTDVYDKLDEQRRNAIANRDNHNAEALQTYLTRLDMYKKEKAKEYIMFCNRGGDSIDTLLGEDEVTVIESNGLAKYAQSFFFTLLMSSIFKYAQGVKGFYTPNQYETFIVLEEANTVLIGGGEDDRNNLGIKKVEEIIDQSRSFGMFIWVLTQKISSMPDSVIANSGLIFSGKSTREKDMETFMRAIGKDPRVDDRDIMKFMPRMPIGEFIVKISKSESELEQEPTLVKVAMLHVDIPTDEELEYIINENEIFKKSAEILE